MGLQPGLRGLQPGFHSGFKTLQTGLWNLQTRGDDENVQFLCVAEVSATHYNSTPYGVGVVVVVVVLAKLKNGITFERLKIST